MNTQKLYKEIYDKINFNFNNISSLNNCGRINSNIRLDLKEHFKHVKMVHGTVSDNKNKAEHMFIIIPETEFNSNFGPVVVDGSIDQFNNYNKDNGSVNVSFGNKNSIESLYIGTLENSPYHDRNYKEEIYR